MQLHGLADQIGDHRQETHVGVEPEHGCRQTLSMVNVPMTFAAIRIGTPMKDTFVSRGRAERRGVGSAE